MSYIVMTASESMPASCWGRYGKVAVVELEAGFSGRPKMISERAKGIKRVVEEWRRLNKGSSLHCAFERAKAEAERLASDLNESDDI